ncbi:hypothetical protein C8R44DRAFT_868416 [Mycena epipterygia]|nr:hypothetical protein C8R44DRAFT_868416 [Mycena epipterygia]
MHQGILTQAANLVQARIQIRLNEAEGWPDSGEIVDLLSLRRLYVSDENILNYLRAPGLQEIVFRGVNDPDYLLCLDPFMLRSGCTLRRLSFNGPLTARAAAEILSKYPSITQLGIFHFSSSHPRVHELISHLTVPDSPGSAALSSQLSDISLGCYDEDDHIDYILFLQMLQSRWKAKDCALKSAALLRDSGTGLAPSTLLALDLLRQDGMDILVLQGTKALDVMDSWTYNPTWI